MTKMQLCPTLPDCIEIPEKWEKSEVKAEKQTAAAHCPFYLFLCKAEVNRRLRCPICPAYVFLSLFSVWDDRLAQSDFDIS